MSKTKKELFLELAEPNPNGVSRWVNSSEFTGKYEDLKFGNGGSWCRRSSSVYKEFIIEKDKSITSGNSIDRIRLNGYRDQKISLTQNIRSDIKRKIQKKRCVVLGTSRVEVDHKDGRKNNSKTMNTSTQKISDFQPLSKAANDAKRQFCKECKRTGKRYDAKKLGYPISVVKGDLNYDDNLGCDGCFWHDPVEFRSYLKLK